MSFEDTELFLALNGEGGNIKKKKSYVRIHE